MANQCGIYSPLNNMQWWTETMSAKVRNFVKNCVSSSWSLSYFQDAILERIWGHYCKEWEKIHMQCILDFIPSNKITI